MIVAIASCPNPPLLLPGATGGEVTEVEQLRGACLAAIGMVLQQRPATIVIVGASQQTDEPDGPLSIQVGQALLAQSGLAPGADVVAEVLTADLPPQECRVLGEQLGADTRRVGLLVMADGTARRTEKAPGYFDPRAEPFDAEIEAALRSGRPETLEALDPQLATELLAAGRPAWQVMAAAAETTAAGLTWRVSPIDFPAPFGVFYPVVVWLPT